MNSVSTIDIMTVLSGLFRWISETAKTLGMTPLTLAALLLFGFSFLAYFAERYNNRRDLEKVLRNTNNRKQ